MAKVSRSSAETEFYRRGDSFRIPGMQVNGMDVLEVRGAAEAALEYVRAGNGPLLMELKTYRYRGHSMSDPAKYRSKEEVQKMRSEQDPIEQVKARLLENGWASEDQLKAIDKDVRDIVADSADFAGGEVSWTLTRSHGGPGDQPVRVHAGGINADTLSMSPPTT